MELAMDPSNLMDDNWRPYMNHQLCGVIGSPMISADIDGHNLSVVTSSADHFLSNWSSKEC
jgi:hypothetical protein